MGFDNRFGLKHADAQSFLLCRPERPEKRILDELLSHSASVVTYGQAYPLPLSACFHSNAAIHVDRIACVKKEVCKHALQLLSISRYLWDLIEFGYEIDVECSI